MPSSRLKKSAQFFEEASSIARIHNKLLPIALEKLSKQLKGFKYTVADVHTLLLQRILNPSKYGNRLYSTAIFHYFLLQILFWSLYFLASIHISFYTFKMYVLVPPHLSFGLYSQNFQNPLPFGCDYISRNLKCSICTKIMTGKSNEGTRSVTFLKVLESK